MLADGRALTDRENEELLEGAKLYVLLVAQGKTGLSGRSSIRGSTLIGVFNHCAELVRWMGSRGLHSFNQLTMEYVIGYRNFQRKRNVRTRKGVSSKRPKKPLARSTLAQLLSVIKQLARLQSEMGDAGTRFSAHEIADLENVLRIDRSGIETHTRPIPDELFCRLLTAAIAFLEGDAPNVLRVNDAYRAYRQNCAGRIDNQRSRGRYQREADGLRLGNPTITLDGSERSLISLTHFDLARLMTLTRAACFIVIAGLVGMRMSEICSLEEDCLEVSAREGGPRIIELRGTVYKTAREDIGESAKWVAGFDEPENPIKLAIEVLRQLPRPGKRLFGPLYEQSSSARTVVSRVPLIRGMQLFMSSAGIAGYIHPHQFRKTFARYVALSSEGSAFTLMRHFKHMSVLMTEKYLSFDPEQVNDIFEASQTIIGERLTSIFGAERLGGIAGQRIVANNHSYRGVENAEALRRLVAMTMSDPEAYFRRTPLGLCIYDKALARCGGKLEDVGIDICVDCSNFAVGEHNRSYWVEAKALLERTTEEQASYGFVSLDVHRQLERVNRVIATLGEERSDGSET